MYDIFLISKGSIEEHLWHHFRSKVPNAQKIENVKTFEDIRSRSFTKLFWVVWDDLILEEDFNFNYRVPKWDEQYIHVFKNGMYYDGVCIFSKQSKILQREWDYRFFTNKKEIDTVASQPRLFDVVFISYNEPFASKNFETLCTRLDGNSVQWVQGVKGIHQAHIEAAKRSSTDLFYAVDADAVLVDDFQFNYQIPYYDLNAKNTVYVWKSQNPVNGLTYGYGGVKLLPKALTINMDLTKPDMTTSISKLFRPMLEISNITAFNTDPFNTWKSAFRECCKLASKVIDRQEDAETKERLRIWCEESTDIYALDGAVAGRDYGLANKTKLDALKLINDFDWLQARFDGR